MTLGEQPTGIQDQSSEVMKLAGSPPTYEQVVQHEYLTGESSQSERQQPIIINQPIILTGHPLMMGPEPEAVFCSACLKNVTTITTRTPGFFAHVSAIFILLTCFPFVFIPYVVDCFKNVNHYCPNCNAFMGTYRR